MENSSKIGEEMHELIKDLFPICRSITGNGTRKTLKIISQLIPITIHEVSTGTNVFDWTVPNEWNINDAFIKSPTGEKIVDFKKSNLHILHNSKPNHKKIPLNELKEHIYTQPDRPEDIPVILDELLNDYVIGSPTYVIRKKTLKNLKYNFNKKFHIIGDFE